MASACHNSRYRVAVLAIMTIQSLIAGCPTLTTQTESRLRGQCGK
jgi:hypothetical protein